MGFLSDELNVVLGALQVPICLLLLVASGGGPPKIGHNKSQHILRCFFLLGGGGVIYKVEVIASLSRLS